MALLNSIKLFGELINHAVAEYLSQPALALFTNMV